MVWNNYDDRLQVMKKAAIKESMDITITEKVPSKSFRVSANTIGHNDSSVNESDN